MPQPVPQYTVGVDVSKNTLDLYELATDHSSVIANGPTIMIGEKASDLTQGKRLSPADLQRNERVVR